MQPSILRLGLRRRRITKFFKWVSHQYQYTHIPVAFSLSSNETGTQSKTSHLIPSANRHLKIPPPAHTHEPQLTRSTLLHHLLQLVINTTQRRPRASLHEYPKSHPLIHIALKDTSAIRIIELDEPDVRPARPENTLVQFRPVLRKKAPTVRATPDQGGFEPTHRQA